MPSRVQLHLAVPGYLCWEIILKKKVDTGFVIVPCMPCIHQILVCMCVWKCVCARLCMCAHMCMCVHVCACACACVCVFMWVHLSAGLYVLECRDQRSAHAPPSTLVLRRGLSLARSLKMRLDWLAHASVGASCSYFLISEITVCASTPEQRLILLLLLMWVLQVKLGSSCLCSEHLTNGAISLAPLSVCKVTSGVLLANHGPIVSTHTAPFGGIFI